MRTWMGVAALVAVVGCAASEPAGESAADVGGGPDVTVSNDVADTGGDDASPAGIDGDGGGAAVDVDTGCGGCLAGDACVPVSGVDPEDPCRVCGGDGKGAAWGTAADGTACPAVHACVEAACVDGACVGELRDCDDGEPCTTDSCDTTTGCLHAAQAGPCDDGDACTEGETCDAGTCGGGAAVDCADGDACTVDSCAPASGCAHALDDGAPCDDGDACTEDEVCSVAGCMATDEDPCDDGDACTADACNPFSGCVHLPTDAACDDGDPCTTDACAGGDCLHEAGPAGTACDDGDACTVGDACMAGACVPGATPLPCDDGNVCTVDGCAPEKGCTHTPGPEGIVCDDGLTCTVEDACSTTGKCKGTPVDCGPCEPTFSPFVLVATSLLIGPDGTPANGVDVDLDPATCAPAGSCSNGIDNAGAALGALMNDGLDGAVTSGEVAYLVEAVWEAGPPDGPFELNLYAGAPTVDGCTPASGGCAYEVWPGMIDADTCVPLTHFDNATWKDGVLTAGGPTFSFPLSLPILPGANLDVSIEAAQIVGKLATDPTGAPVSFDGVIGGAVRQDVLEAAIYQIPPDALILPPDQLVGLMKGLLTLDIDTDGDGVADAYSVGFKATAKPTTVVGVAP